MFVCVCYNVTDKDIKHAVNTHGVGNVRELKQHLQLGDNCGKCIAMAQDIIDTQII
ncbi:MAG: (2Fe-2S)-binding protein, partial [Glaciecola sp.]